MLALSLALIFAAPAWAAIYKWTDEGGSLHFTDNLQSVPPRYRDQIETRSDRLPPARAPRRIPLEASASGYIVKAKVDGKAVGRLVVDTGASVTVLSPRLARSAALTVRMDPPVTLQTASGTVHAGWARVDQIDVAGRKNGPIRVVIHDALPGADGLLGMDFLGAYRVEILADGPTLLLSAP